jgi:hypothetical protein
MLVVTEAGQLISACEKGWYREKKSFSPLVNHSINGCVYKDGRLFSLHKIYKFKAVI